MVSNLAISLRQTDDAPYLANRKTIDFPFVDLATRNEAFFFNITIGITI